MAIIACPGCKKKISDKAKTCEHCQLDLTNLDQEKLANIQKIALIEKSQQLMTISFIAMLLFCGGFLFLYWGNPDPNSWQYLLSNASIAIGFLLYIATRAYAIYLKRNGK